MLIIEDIHAGLKKGGLNNSVPKRLRNMRIASDHPAENWNQKRIDFKLSLKLIRGIEH
jgi:hypothetical protein